MQIPGQSNLITRETEKIPDSLLLLCGPAGAGKSMYCKQFFVDCLMNGYYCIYISSSLTDRQYRSLFADIDESKLLQGSHFLNPYLQKTLTGHSSSLSTSVSENKLSLTLEMIDDLIKKVRSGKEEEEEKYDYEKKQNKVIGHSLDNTKKKICLVVDSLTHLLAIFNEDDVLQFVNALYFLLKEVEATAIFVLTTSSSQSSTSSSSATKTTINDNFTNRLGSIFDGILEMKFDDDKSGSLIRNIRLLSIRGIHHTPTWISFKIDNNGRIIFGSSEQSSESICVLCKAPILDTPVIYSELTFHTHHVDLYKKLLGVYGSNISEFGLPEGVINANFFFIDIVGLSDPSLSVRKQMEKIERLNNLINSCDAFKKATEKKIILPTGDGMAIGFMLNPELPLQLSIQLHKELYRYNNNLSKKISEEDIIGVRIGLATGPVFIVSDINNNQNIWGPGIILARRVMDLGDSGHILIADILAEQLIALKDEYRVIIKPVGNYQIKHGQTVKMYSAYSHEFGNPDPPAKFPKSNLSVDQRND